ncbi:hypothetical protein DFH94DRAFT_786983 [Russula ochroleuca]|jgi:hypothetical protein|uniref:MATH domain-containing protein n=1 Tax=Russula ochroleuca TaxID=152965 RepID=A0A9P5JTR3_9AGAM|nr:hypothetical protein DFH94DRAFT_786983 [Russula ochroleuca]
MEAVEFQESNSITFEWTLRGLKALFESSKGDAKSKVTKSTKFGGGRWQVLFYANSGPPYPSTDVSNASAGGYVSLFLSCEPTQEEKDAAYNGRWVREGLFRFTFELHSLKKKELFNIKEAHNHSFSHATANWGWAQFARRDAVYYSKSIVKANDAFVINCSISSTPGPPTPSPLIHKSLVPKDLLESVGQLLDDPLYSDIEFVLPSRSPCVPSPRRIYASKRLLSRADYFDSMFNAGFVEASTDQLTFEITGDSLDGVDATSEYTAIGAHPEDSDEEDEAYDPGEADGDPPNSDAEPEEVFEMPRDLPEPVSVESAELVDDDHSGEGQDGKSRNVRQKLAHPSSPRASIAQIIPRGPATVVEKEALGPPKLRVVVKDVAYSTYRAVLYYLYTDRIRFAPLSSSFLSSSSSGTSCEETPNDSQGSLGTVNRTGPSEVLAGASSRREWIQDYIRGNPGHPLPCSAKAVYRLADKLGLVELKARAFEHITKSLTVENVPYEVFSTFSATFEVVRKVEVKYFLDHWTEIRSSDAMRKVWHQIRLGRHPGFEEVWPVIATHLEFKPQSSGLVGNDKEDSR